ncbi:MAG: TetR/AcrR family transcriptional regulator [Pseudomonadota bacterium]
MDTAAIRPAGNVKVTRDDWLNAAMAVLVDAGVEQVKILTLSERLAVSRSSFYWYFEDRQHLLDDLLEVWNTSNTGVIQHHCALPSATIAEAVLNLFRCFVGANAFDHRLDFAVREWSRRSAAVRQVVDRADAARLSAIAAMFARHGYDPAQAESRARILYYMQIGYFAMELNEPLEERLGRVAGYVAGFTGVSATPVELGAFTAHVRQSTQGDTP